MRIKIVYFLIDYVPHQILSIETLIENHNAQILAFHVGLFEKKLPIELKNFETYNYKSISKNNIIKKILAYNPQMIVTAGWMIPKYNSLCRTLKKSLNIPIVAMTDTPWIGSLRQRINVLSSPLNIKKLFTHIWVSGYYQYDYARKLGFENDKIIFNSLSANTSLFSNVRITDKEKMYPKNFLYVGRLIKVKGLENLVMAWNDVLDKNGWTLTVIGDGNLKETLKKQKSIIVKDYKSQEELIIEFQNAGCFLVPSLYEPWALVIHEAASAGLPIICTKTCGASPHFVIDNYNGYKVANNSVDALKTSIDAIIDKTDKELIEFSKNSRILSNSITLEKLCANLLQLIKVDG